MGIFLKVSKDFKRNSSIHSGSFFAADNSRITASFNPFPVERMGWTSSWNPNLYSPRSIGFGSTLSSAIISFLSLFLLLIILRAFQERVAHLIRCGNFETPDKKAASPNSSWRGSDWPWTISEKTCANSSTSSFVFPITASVIILAEAVEIVQPEFTKAISSTLSFSSNFTLNWITSPQVGLLSWIWSTSSICPWWWGCFEWSATTAMYSESNLESAIEKLLCFDQCLN